MKLNCTPNKPKGLKKLMSRRPTRDDYDEEELEVVDESLYPEMPPQPNIENLIKYAAEYFKAVIYETWGQTKPPRPRWEDRCIEMLQEHGFLEKDHEYEYYNEEISAYCHHLFLVALQDFLETVEHEDARVSDTLLSLDFSGSDEVAGGHIFKAFTLNKIKWNKKLFVLGTLINSDGDLEVIIFSDSTVDALELLEEIKKFYGKNPIWNAVLSFGGGYASPLEFMDKVQLIDKDALYISKKTMDMIYSNTIFFLKNREKCKKKGIDNGRKILMYGDPGNGKTMTVKYLIKSAYDENIKTLVIYPRGSRVDIDAIFEIIDILSPVLVVWDDADMIMLDRDINVGSTILGKLLGELDGARRHSDYTLVASTNRLELIESALSQRPGRFDRVIKINKPDLEGVKYILLKNLRNFDLSPEELEKVSEEIMRETKLSGAMVREVAHTAIIDSIKHNNKKIKVEEVRNALRELKSSDNRVVGY